MAPFAWVGIALGTLRPRPAGRAVAIALMLSAASAAPAASRAPTNSPALPPEVAQLPPAVPAPRDAICGRLDHVLHQKLAATERHKTEETRHRLQCAAPMPGVGSSHPPRPRPKPRKS
jgi:hypothetical protein